jgi:hypothetical protein
VTPDGRSRACTSGCWPALQPAAGVSRAGRGPVLWATTPALLEHFGLDGVDNSPNLGEVRTEGRRDFVTAAAVDNAGDANPGDRRKCRNLRGTTPLLLHCLPRTYREHSLFARPNECADVLHLSR